MAQEVDGLDYECELVAIIGKEAREVPESKALDYVMGYAVGDDVSHREWQLKRGGGQWALGKGFDGWAPYGPGIVSSSLINDPQALRISTKVKYVFSASIFPFLDHTLSRETCLESVCSSDMLQNSIYPLN